MGILGLPYVNNTLGVDLLNENRPYTIIDTDEKIGVLDNEFLLVIKQDQSMSLFKYKNLDKTNYVHEYYERTKQMEMYAKSNMQVFQYLLLNNKQYIEPVIPGN